MVLYQGNDGKTVPQNVISETCKKVFEAMKTGLPVEAQSYDMCNFVLDECKKELANKKVQL